MELFSCSTNDGTLNEIEIKRIIKKDLLYLQTFDIHAYKRLEKELDKISILSSNEQKLLGTLTSLRNIIENNHKLYCLLKGNIIIGILKIGYKNLYLYDKENLQYNTCLCVLDFYIHENFRRQGLGFKLFNYMLKDNNVEACDLCYDNPSIYLYQFLKKHFTPNALIKQPNNFVIFSNYFKQIIKNPNSNFKKEENTNVETNGEFLKKGF